MHEVERRLEILALPAALVERPGAPSSAAEVETEDGAANPCKRLGCLIDHLGVHRAAILRVRMGEHDCRFDTSVRVAVFDEPVGIDAARSGRLVKERLEASGGPGNLTQHGPAIEETARTRE